MANIAIPTLTFLSELYCINKLPLVYILLESLSNITPYIIMPYLLVGTSTVIVVDTVEPSALCRTSEF